MDKITLRPVEAGDIQYIAAHLCEGERLTWTESMGDANIEAALANSVMHSHPCEAGVLNGRPEPLLIVGIMPMTEQNTGYLWMVATAEAFEHSRALVRAGLRYVARAEEKYPHLIGQIDARHDGTLRWLRAMGFNIEHPPIIRHGVQFVNFSRQVQ